MPRTGFERRGLGRTLAVPRAYRAELAQLGEDTGHYGGTRGPAGRGQARGVGLVVKRVTYFRKPWPAICACEGLSSCATP